MKCHHTGHQSLGCAATPMTKLAVKTVCPVLDSCRGCAPGPFTEDSKLKGPSWPNPQSASSPGSRAKVIYSRTGP